MKLSKLKKVIKESIQELQRRDTSKNLLTENCVAETWVIECLCSINPEDGSYNSCEGSAWISSTCETGSECSCCPGQSVGTGPTKIHKK